MTIASSFGRLWSSTFFPQVSGVRFLSHLQSRPGTSERRDSKTAEESSRPLYVERLKSSLSFRYRDVVRFEPPEWAREMKDIPTKRVLLAITPTPIHSWQLPGQPNDFTLAIKREDMTGSALSGNKVRKLEFLMADALERKCGAVITCGTIQSNHCRATAIAARELGLEPYLVMRAPPDVMEDPQSLTCLGNQLTNRMAGAGIILIPPGKYEADIKPRMKTLIEQIRQERGISTYLVPLGGTDKLGLWGSFCAFNELLEQGVASDYDDIVFACGSGGTAVGLAIGNYLCGSPLKIHGVLVSDENWYFKKHLDEIISEIGLADAGVKAEDVIDIIEGYQGRGYGVSAENEIDFNLKVACQTGIVLDPVYTGKATIGLVSEMRINPSRFKGKRILFIHTAPTGGLSGQYDTQLETALRQNSAQVVSWQDPSQTPKLPTIPS